MLSTLHRRGLTRIETVVVAGLSVLTLGLLLPALQQVRAQGRGTSCRLNLARIAIAAHNYHDVYGVFPPGMDPQYVGTLVHLLPFVDQDILYRNFSFSDSYPLYWKNPYNLPATDGTDRVPRPPDVYGCEWEVRTYLCPNAPQPPNTVTGLLAVRYGTAGVDYRANDGLRDGHLYAGSPGRLVLARSHYLGMAGDWRTEGPYNGLYRGIFRYNSRTRIPDIVDGASNTVLFAEQWGGYVGWRDAAFDIGGIPSGWSTPSRSAGFNYSTFGNCPDPANRNCDYSNQGLGLSFGTFGALHGKGFNQFNVALADGTVLQFPGNFDFNVWTAMCGYRDGMIRPRDLEPLACGARWD